MSHHSATDADDVFASLARVEPGFVEITHPDGAVDYLYVDDFPLTPDRTVSVGFTRYQCGASLGKPVFLSKRMQARHLGRPEDYFSDSFFIEILTRLQLTGEFNGDALLLVRTAEAIRAGQATLDDARPLFEAMLERQGAQSQVGSA